MEASTDIQSPFIADVGISMGDEGKGRLIPELVAELSVATGRADAVGVVLKVNGGANSGHTAAGLKLNLLPAGVSCAEVPHLALGAGVVADPRKLYWEAEALKERGYDVYPRLAIDERTMLSDLSHRLLDLAWEDYREHILKEEPRGSTGRGITPAYNDETGQFQIYYGDLRLPRDEFAAKLRSRLDRALRTIQHVCQVTPERFEAFFEVLTAAETRANAEAIAAGVFAEAEFDFHRFRGTDPFTLDVEALVETYWTTGQRFCANIVDVRDLIMRTADSGQYVIGEFGQSFWLDKRHGFTPNVTASHTYTPEFFQSAGQPSQPIHVVGCCKAYDTKVGTHRFLTEMDDARPLTQRLKQLEFGTSTGRQRMVGWFDAVEKGDALRYGGFDDLVFNKLDALTSINGDAGTLRICVAYQTPDGQEIRRVPRTEVERAPLRPVYLNLPGWDEDISEVRCFIDLPANAQRYVAACVEAMLTVASRDGHTVKPPRVRYIGVGPSPAQIIADCPPIEVLAKLASVV